MADEPVNLTLGTAGHIDHGKTLLVKMLTGCETDRLKEEKARGMSIELGFAPCRIAGTEVGICDVPGHERFVKTMVAGASAIDGVILVVAADDGVMPQTREHMDILTLLGVAHGLVALTKIDRVSPERREAAAAETRAYLGGTFLRDAPLCPLSSVTGEGFDGFLTALGALVRSIRPRRTDRVFRLPVERAFSVKGVGTVVAGVPLSGQARVGDAVVLLPQGAEGRIRAIQVYGRDTDTVRAGQCAALQVPHWDAHTIARGDTVAAPGYFQPESWYACRLHLLAHEHAALKTGARVKFHTGTSEVAASVFLLEGDRAAGGAECLVQVRLDAALVAGPGDRFIVRTLSPVWTVGGGVILSAIPGRLKRNRPEILEDLRDRAAAVGDERALVAYCIRRAEGLASTVTQAAHQAKVPEARVPAILAGLVAEGKVVELAGGLYVHAATLAAVTERLAGILADHHRAAPESPGLEFDDLLAASGLARPVLAALVERLKADGRLAAHGARVALAEHRPTVAGADQERLDRIEALFRERPFNPPGEDEVAQAAGLGAAEVGRLLKILTEHERLVPVPPGLLFHRDAVAAARERLLGHLRKEGRLESVDFKYLLETTRKFAIPLLDYFDRTGLTRRVGYTRYLRAGRGDA